MKLLLATLVVSTMMFMLPLNAKITDKALYNELVELKPSQKKLLVKVYHDDQRYNLRLLLVVIAWLESNFGVNLEGKTTPDYGVFGINIHTFKNRFQPSIKGFKLTDNTIKNMLKYDYDIGVLAATEEIKFWDKQYNNWDWVIMSYNAGWNRYNARVYLHNIKQRTKVLKSYLKNNPSVITNPM